MYFRMLLILNILLQKFKLNNLIKKKELTSSCLCAEAHSFNHRLYPTDWIFPKPFHSSAVNSRLPYCLFFPYCVEVPLP
jgi:hypothetical protein